MNLLPHPTIARRFIQALLLALLLNLSGHVFLHLGDVVSAGDEPHLTSQQESKATSAPQHQCSICQDHQHLALESPSVVAFQYADATALLPASDAALLSVLALRLKSSRAPPRA